MAQFGSQPMGGRTKTLLDTPVKFDPEAAMGKILQQKQVAVPFGKTSFEGPHNEWIIRESGITYGRKQALDLWNQGYETGTDANNQPIKKWANEQFDRIKKDPAQLQKFGNPKDPQEFYQKLGEMMYGSKEDIQGEKTPPSRTANPYALLTQRENAALYMEGIREGNREKLAGTRATLALQTAPENANFLVKSYANLLGNTVDKPQIVDVGNGVYKTEEKVDVPMPILKTYAESGKETLTEGKSTDKIRESIVQGNEPDLKTRTNDGNLRLTYYQRYKETDKIPKGKKVGEIVTNQAGSPIIDKTGVIPRRSLLTTLGKGVVAPKILAYSIDEADKALRGRSNSDIDKINAGEDSETAITTAAKEKHSAAKSYSFKGKKYSAEQVQQAANNLGIPVEAYIKKYGLQ